MSSLFVSYAHADAAFVDRLVDDLRGAGLPATCDKWLLQVGDSIIERISAAVTQADAVVVVLSPASVTSNWVRKELSLAMVLEVDGTPLRVLPALIADCDLPPPLRDKLYADFRGDYVAGLAALVRALRPADTQRAQQHLDGARERAHERAALEALLAAGVRAPVLHWLAQHPHVLRGALRAGAPLPRAGGQYLLLETNSIGTHLSLLELGPVDLDPVDDHWLRAQMERLHEDRQQVAASAATPAGRDALRLQDLLHQGTDPMGWLRDGGEQHPEDGIWVDPRARLVAGRRANYDETPLGACRLQLINHPSRQHDVVSYDRFLDFFDRQARRPT